MWSTGGDGTGSGSTVSTTSTVRVINERAVFDVLADLQSASVAELVTATGLSKPTIAVALTDLEAAGLIDQSGRRTGVAGRAARLYRLRPAAGAALAIDVGRAWVRAALVDLSATVVARKEERAKVSSAAALLDQISKMADSLVELAGIDRALVTHTVLGSPGVHDRIADVMRLAPNLPGWGQPDLVARLRSRLPGELRIENDINLAALAELAELSAGARPIRDFVFLSAGSGLGLGIVLGGRLVRGAHGAAGEVSYLPFGAIDGPPLDRQQSIEQLTGPAALIQTAQRSGMTGASRPEDVFSAARSGSRAAEQAVTTEARRLAVALAGVVAVLDPGLVVLGGGIGRNGDLLLEPLRQALATLVPLEPPQLRVSELGTDAPLLGAISDGLIRARQHAFDAAVSLG